jgi:hypothetical protein
MAQENGRRLYKMVHLLYGKQTFTRTALTGNCLPRPVELLDTIRVQPLLETVKMCSLSAEWVFFH